MVHPSEEMSPYINRELSWLKFNRRVLEQALNPDVPILDRVRFLTIFSSNCDEFFMVRVAGLKKMSMEGIPNSESPEETPISVLLHELRQQMCALLDEAKHCLVEQILPSLRANNIFLVPWDETTEAERVRLKAHFRDMVYPILTPLAVDPSHPFPFLSNLSHYMLVEFSDKRIQGNEAAGAVGFVEIPAGIPALVPLDTEKGHRFVFLDTLIKQCMEQLFLGFPVSGAYSIRVTRNLDYMLLESEVSDLLKSVQKEVVNREHQEAVRLQVDPHVPERYIKMIQEELSLTDADTYIFHDPIRLGDLKPLLDIKNEDLYYPSFNPRLPRRLSQGADIFALISQEDLMVHHPYESFYTVIEFLNFAARDEHVVAIKQTLYRTSGTSPIIQALITAAENEKQVTAVVELKARFDERNNIDWARRLERAGVNVVFGFVGLKTHAKATLVIRREDDKLVRYSHLSTGNYNPDTAKSYEDIGIFTKDPMLGNDLVTFFNLLTGFNILKPGYGPPLEAPEFKVLKVAPINLRESLVELIDEEIAAHSIDGNGMIIAKMNALVDKRLIDKLYEASQAGVSVRLIVRGICCLRPGVKGLSENIRVFSVINRFLEHSRIYYFHSGGKERTFLASADWMPRNMQSRVELMFPLFSRSLKKRMRSEILAIYLDENLDHRELMPDGNYVAKNASGEFRGATAQQQFIAIVREGGVKSLPYDKALEEATKLRRPMAKRTITNRPIKKKVSSES